jgi:LysR family glycine cleavage system transcriptional activator
MNIEHKRVARKVPEPRQDLEVSAFGGLPLHELVALEAAARLGSFALAAEELCVTRSAVSHRIKQLEGKLGVELFARAGSRTQLLPAGRRLLEPIAAALNGLRDASAALDDVERKVVRLAVPRTLGTIWLVPHLGGFQREHPGIQLEIMPVTTDNDGAATRVDVAVETASSAHDSRVLPVTLRVVGAPTMLAACRPLDSAAALRDMVLLRHPRFPWSAWSRLAFGEPIDAPTAYYFDDTVAMLEASAGGLGLALAPDIACAPYLAQRRLLSAHPVMLESQACRAVVSAAGAVKPAARALAEWLERCLRADARAVIDDTSG